MIEKLIAMMESRPALDFITEEDLKAMAEVVKNDKLKQALKEGLWETELKKFMAEEFVEGKVELILGSFDRQFFAIRQFEPRNYPKGPRTGWVIGDAHHAVFMNLEEARKLQAYLNRELSN